MIEELWLAGERVPAAAVEANDAGGTKQVLRCVSYTHFSSLSSQSLNVWNSAAEHRKHTQNFLI